MSGKPIFYYLSLFQGGPPDQTGLLGGKMHLIRFGDTYTGSPGEFNGRVVVYSHGLRRARMIRFGKPEKQVSYGSHFYKTHFLSGLFSKNEAAFAALETVELAVCHSGIADPRSVLDTFSQNLPKGVVTRGPIDTLAWIGETWRVGKVVKEEPLRSKSQPSSSSITNYFLKGDIGGLDLYFRSVGEPGRWFDESLGDPVVANKPVANKPVVVVPPPVQKRAWR